MASRTTTRHCELFTMVLRLAVVLSACCLLPVSESGAWWFAKSEQEYLAEALRSTNPKKVEKCLDRQIRHKNFPGILKLRKHARDMIREEQNKRNTAQGITPERLKRNLAPWMRIEKRATEFYKQSVD